MFLDATWLVASARAEAHARAARAGVPVAIIDLRCDAEEIERRLRARDARGDDASDAGVAVFREQLRTAEPLSEDERGYVIPHVSGEPTGALLMALLSLGLEGAAS